MPSRFFWVLVLALLVIGERGYAGLMATDSAVFERFSEATVKFMRRAYEGIRRRAWKGVGTALRGCSLGSAT